MKKLLTYLKDYKKESFFAPLFKMLEAILELFVPLIIASIINTGVGEQDTSYIVKMGILLVLLGIAGLAMSITAQYFAAKAAVGVATSLRSSLFAHLQTFSYTEIDTFTPSTMITRMTSDVNQVQTGINLFLRLFLRSPFIVFSHNKRQSGCHICNSHSGIDGNHLSDFLRLRAPLRQSTIKTR